MCPVVRFDCVGRLVDGLFGDFAESVRAAVVAGEQGSDQALLGVEGFVGAVLQILLVYQVIVPFLVLIEHFTGCFCIIADEHEINPAHEMESQVVAEDEQSTAIMLPSVQKGRDFRRGIHLFHKVEAVLVREILFYLCDGDFRVSAEELPAVQDRGKRILFIVDSSGERRKVGAPFLIQGFKLLQFFFR